VGGDIFYTRQDRGPCSHPGSCTIGTGSLPGLKRPGRCVDHLPPSSAEVSKTVYLYLCCPLWAFMAYCRVNFTFYLFYCNVLYSSYSLNVNKKVQLDATVCRHLFTEQSLYMFRVSQHPSSGVLKTVSATSGIGHDTGTATSFQRGLQLLPEC